tara:strand:+ start:2359 stop:2925 length:567 start_codon:yes stop_codon:yes gene_type:complete
MIKIGITGSIASGKTTASKILSRRRGPLFSADIAVQELYKKDNFKRVFIKRFNITNKLKLKTLLKRKILNNKINIKKLERIVHPLVRKEMKNFSRKNKNKKMLFYEIPLLIESKLMNYFDIIVFIKANKDIRLKRFKAKGGNKKLFNLLSNKQLQDSQKGKFCNHVVVNEKNLTILKKNLLDIIKLYE